MVARVTARPAVDRSDRNAGRIELVIDGVVVWRLAEEHALERAQGLIEHGERIIVD